MCDEATTTKMHSKVRWGKVGEVGELLKLSGAADCKVGMPPPSLALGRCGWPHRRWIRC